MGLVLKNTVLDRNSCDIRIEHGIFTDISPRIDGTKDDTFFNAEGKIIIPSMKNAHTHAAMTLLRGWGDDMKLQPWLEKKIWPMEEKIMKDKEACYWGTKFACLEMIKTGTTFANDMYFNYFENVRAFKEMGIKASMGAPLYDFLDSEQTKIMKEQCLQGYKNFKEDENIRFCLNPHSIYTVSRELLKWVGDFARDNNLPVHIHLSETKEEADDCFSSNGKSPVAYLKDVGLLGPNLITAHTVWVSEEDIRILADYNVTVVHNPVSNMKLSVGNSFPFASMHKQGIPIMLGTDGVASNNNLDMFEEMKFAALLQKHHTADPEIMKAEEIFNIATGGNSSFFPHISGEISVGAHADCLLLNPDTTPLIPDHHTLSNIVYAADGSCVDTVISGGKILMKHRKIEGEEEIISNFKAMVKRLF